MIPEKSVIQYVRNKKKIPLGVIVAVKDENSPNGFRLGYSLCSKKDRFKKTMAIKVALGRAHSGWETAPRDIERILEGFKERCKRYYRT